MGIDSHCSGNRKTKGSRLNKLTLDGKDIAKEASDQVLHLRKQISEQASTIKKLRAELGSQAEFAEAVCAAVVAADPFPPSRPQRATKTGKPVAACIKLSDWHIGEVIRSSEVEGFNSYNWQIAQERIFSIVRDFL